MIVAKKGIHHRHFASVAEFMAYCAQVPKRGYNAKKHQRIASGQEGNGGVSWYGVDTVAQVEAAVSEGWKEGADAIEALYSKMVKALPRAIDVRRHRVRGDQGEELDIHAVYRGDLSRAWSTTTRALRHGTSIVRIVADVCDNGGVSAKQLQWRGVAALALSRILQRAGYSVEVAVAIGGAGETADDAHSKNKALTTVVVKPRHVAQDTRLLAATVALPGFFRLYGFLGIVNRADDRGCDVGGGLGRAVNADSMIEPDSRVLQTVTPPLMSAEQVERWIADTIKLFQKATIAAESGRG